MIKKISIALMSLLSVCFSLRAQEVHGVCGTTIKDQEKYTDRLDANIEAVETGAIVAERGAVQYVPVYFHLVGDIDGNGKIKERLVLEQLCDLNKAYAPTEMRFYLSPHPTYGLFDYSINSNTVYSNQNNTSLMINRRHQNALNVYIVDNAGSGSGIGTILAYYNPDYDWIVSRKDQINGTGNGTLPHETGHFFSLRHTFYGYEGNPFESSDPSWPVAPVVAPYSDGVTIYTERQNGTNCSTAADKICDTPPDYNFGSLADDCSAYKDGAKDPLSTPVDPMENNYMGYFSKCNYVFTPAQQNLILADRETTKRNYLDNNYTPAVVNINTPTNLLLSPAANDTVDYYDEALFEWQAVAGATYYLLEFDIINTFLTAQYYQSFVVSGTSRLVTSLQSNRKYYWRVRPFNEYVTCAEARTGSFRTSQVSATVDIKELSGLQVAPNPVNGAAPVRLFVNASEDFEALVSIFDATGRQVRALGNKSFPAGENTLELPVEEISTGLYFIALENAGGRAIRKLAVVR